MQDESEQLGASGIVAVQLEQKSHQWGSHTIEFLALGTAVTKRDGEVDLPRPIPIISFDRLMADASLPGDASTRLTPTSFSSRLTTADYSSTLSAGLEPVGIVQGVCVMRWAWYGPRSPYGGDSPIGSGSKKTQAPDLRPEHQLQWPAASARQRSSRSSTSRPIRPFSTASTPLR